MKSLKKIIILPILLFGFIVSAQTTSNRFFYELTFRPKKDSAKIETVMTTLDITKDKSLFNESQVIYDTNKFSSAFLYCFLSNLDHKFPVPRFVVNFVQQ